MYKSGDKFIIELKESLFNPEDLFSDTKVWRIERVKNFVIDEESLHELGKFDEEIWLKTLDNLRDRVSSLKVENKRLEEENKLKDEMIVKLKGENNVEIN